jgi:stress response protein YsnF
MTVEVISYLPVDKAEEISDFADFVKKRYEESELVQGIQRMTSESAAFEFLNEEEELYSVADLQIVYNA